MFMASLVNNEYGNMGCKVSKGGIQNQVILDPNRPGPQLRDMGNNMHVIKSPKRRPLSKVQGV